MSDNEIEDVSFLPGESLHRKAVYEPSIIQKLRLIVCSRGRLVVIVTVTVLIIIVIGLIAALSHHKCPDAVVESVAKQQDGKIEQDYIDTEGKPFPYKKVRLPSSVVPLHYKLFMHPNLTQSLFTGNVDIVCQVKQETSFIVFHIKNLNITKLSVRLKETGNQYGVKEYQEYKTNEQVLVQLDTGLTPGSNVTLSISFRGDLVKKLAGFYKSSYKTKSGQLRYLATTHFEPTDARAAFPCFDEPQLKATFELSIIRDKSQVALFNMPLKTSTDYKGGLIQDNFDRSVNMSTYLVAFVVCDYQKISQQTKRNVTVSVYAPGDLIQSADFAVRSATKIIDYYEDFFNVIYPLPKQDLIAIPDFAAGAMENWGLITYRITDILYDPQVATEKNKERVAVVIAHELAHQWFGNLVTMFWWDNLWLNEGFATYVEYIGSAIIQPDWKMEEQFVFETLLRSLYIDSLSNSHPVDQPVDNPNQINDIFDSISYSKGASIIRMLANYLGDDVFRLGLTAYLRKYQFSNAVTNNLWDSLAGVSTTDVGSMMKTWTDQMGYPVINVRRHGNKVILTQSRFLLYNNPNHTDMPSPFGYRWQIPFTYTTSSNPQTAQKFLLKKATETFQLPSAAGWIKGNSGMFGYYRVNYEEDNWKKLTQQLFKKDHGGFTAAERAGLMDDAFMLARAGLLNYSIVLDLTLYMVNEEDYLPWKTLLDNMAYLQVRVEKTPAFANYKAYLLTLMKKQLDIITWEDTGTLLQKYLKSAILSKAVYLGHKESVDKGLQLFQIWKSNHSSINLNLKRVIYMCGMRHGTENDWQHMWESYLTELDSSERNTLLSSLGKTQDASLMSRYLTYGLDEKYIKSQDTVTVIRSVTDSFTGMILAWRTLQQKWDIFFTRYGGTAFLLSSMIKSVTWRFDSKFDYTEVSTFFKARDAGSATRAVQQVLEKIEMNIDWISRHEEMVTDWFQKHGKVN